MIVCFEINVCYLQIVNEFECFIGVISRVLSSESKLKIE